MATGWFLSTPIQEMTFLERKSAAIAAERDTFFFMKRVESLQSIQVDRL